ncbi:RNA polymerase sigma-70 factor [Terriglobus albidus]|uniref:RNA polymerase sigma-70 factor n=1 Tax=Terriglobus albidus TaxID=1592106 RepID=UPI0021DF9029|nr:RNA polymerase sigma-70 factor [Terriglobus albidus]
MSSHQIPGPEPLNDAERSIRLGTFDQYRSLLFSIAYRMLGSVADAEDMLQETFLRWHAAGEEEIRSPRAYLVTILSRLCINHLQSAKVQREEYTGMWLPEPIVTDLGAHSGADPFYLIRVDESLSMAFLILLERLTPIERAVFLLKEVFEYEHAEIASIVGQSEVNCRQILKRAKQHVAALRPRFAAARPNHGALLESFLKAVGTGEMTDLLSLLTEDVVLRSDGGGKAAAVPNAVHGADKVGRGILGGMQRFVPKTLVRRLAHINGDPGLVTYFNGEPYSVVTIEVRDNLISSIYVITNPDKLKHLPRLK